MHTELKINAKNKNKIVLILIINIKHSLITKVVVEVEGSYLGSSMKLLCFPYIALGLVWESKIAGGVYVEALNLSPLPSVCLDWSYLKRFTAGCSGKAVLCRVGLLLLRNTVFLRRALISTFLHFKIVRQITKKDAYSVNVLELEDNCIIFLLNPLSIALSHSFFIQFLA